MLDSTVVTGVDKLFICSYLYFYFWSSFLYILYQIITIIYFYNRHLSNSGFLFSFKPIKFLCWNWPFILSNVSADPWENKSFPIGIDISRIQEYKRGFDIWYFNSKVSRYEKRYQNNTLQNHTFFTFIFEKEMYRPIMYNCKQMQE